MKTWIISDTHGKHRLLDIPNNIDMCIFAGDAGTVKNPSMNVNSILDFLDWFKSLNHIKYKIMIAGNHCTSIEAGLVTRGDIHESITYLEHEYIEIEGLKIFGSPYTPEFHNWAFNVSRHKLDPYWQDIPNDIDILITHGPPKGILDLTKRNGYDQCGCKSLLNRVKITQPRFHIFGHIHTEEGCSNAGIYEMNGLKTKFINASVLNLDYQICNNGFIIEI